MWPAFRAVADVRPRAWDDLASEAVLEEQELLDVRLDPGRSTVGAMIISSSELRVIVARRVRALSWVLDGYDLPTLGQRFCREVGTSSWTSMPDGLLRWDLGVEASSDLSVTAFEFACYEVHVEGLPDAPPDYGELDDAAIHRERPDWSSPFLLLSWARRTVEGA